MLSSGTVTTARLFEGEATGVSTCVNGDRGFDARTTRRAAGLLASEVPAARGAAELDQVVGTPIGSGFGSSASSATSAVYALAAAGGADLSKRRLARYAHLAEIQEQTGLGTVSVIYDHVGAGAIAVPGEPGEARFVRVKVPRGTKIVTAYAGPFDKREAFASPSVRRRVDTLGHEALGAFLSDPTLDSLASQGELFSLRLGVDSPEVRKLVSAAKSAGAEHASQNMIGYSVHCISGEDDAAKVARALGRVSSAVRVDVFEVGERRAGVVHPSRR